MDGHSGGERFGLLKYTPVHALWAGYEAVIVFFILSGFVLSLPFWAGSGDYVGFMVKRVLRLYPAYLLAVGAGLLAMALLSRSPVPGASDWFNLGHPFARPSPVQVVKLSTLLVGQPFTPLNTVFWSLEFEIRISLLFPLLILAMAWVGPARTLALTVAVVAADNLAAQLGHTHLHATLEYVPLFVLGAWMARERSSLTAALGAWSGARRWSLLAFGVLCYSWTWWVLPGTGFHLQAVNDVLIAVGAAVFILMALGDPATKRAFSEHPTLLFLGRISYSLYLIHDLVLQVLVRETHSFLPLPVAVVLAVAVAIGLAALSFWIVERPSIELGRRLVKKGRLPRLPVRLPADQRQLATAATR